jgi:hypothetical protein
MIPPQRGRRHLPVPAQHSCPSARSLVFSLDFAAAPLWHVHCHVPDNARRPDYLAPNHCTEEALNASEGYVH